MEAALSIFVSNFTSTEFLVPTVWSAFGCVVDGFLLSAKKTQEITMNENQIIGGN